MGTYTESQEDFVNRMHQAMEDALYFLSLWAEEEGKEHEL